MTVNGIFNDNIFLTLMISSEVSQPRFLASNLRLSDAWQLCTNQLLVLKAMIINFSSKMSVRKLVYGLDEAMDSSNPVQINPLWKSSTYTKVPRIGELSGAVLLFTGPTWVPEGTVSWGSTILFKVGPAY